MVNHFEFHYLITTKNHLIKSLTSYCEVSFLTKINRLLYFKKIKKQKTIKLKDITPTTFIINLT